MFRHFHSHFPAPAWEGAYSDRRFWENQPFRHNKGARRGWGDQPRMRRGEIKMILLELLSEHPLHGYELIKELESRSCRVSPGSVYPTLQMLEEGGYLTSEIMGDKRVYTITESGKQLLSDRKTPTEQSFRFQPPAELLELKKSMTELNDAVTIVARSENLEQTNKVRDLLVQLKREIYKILSE